MITNLGFMTTDQVNNYPAHVHAFSPQLTLQGADRPLRHADTSRNNQAVALVHKTGPANMPGSGIRR